MALVHEGHRLGASHIAGCKMRDGESAALNERTDRAIQVTTAAEAFPHGRKAMLPPLHALLGRLSVLDEEQLSIRLQHTAHFAQCCSDIWNRAERPGGDHCIDAM